MFEIGNAAGNAEKVYLSHYILVILMIISVN